MPNLSRTMRPAGVAVGLFAGVLVALGPADTARADYWADYALTVRPAGLPATDDPARQLESGTVTFAQDRDGSALSASLVLAAEPADVDDADVLVAFGSQDASGACVPTVQRSSPTYAPEGESGFRGGRDGATLTLAWLLTEEESRLAGDAGCALARVVDPADGTTLDELDGDYHGGVVSDPVYRADLGAMTGRSVRPHRWSTVRVRVTSRSDVRGFTLRGYGADVEVRARRIDRPLAEGRSRSVALRVRLAVGRARPFRLFLSTYDSYGQADMATYRLLPRR